MAENHAVYCVKRNEAAFPGRLREVSPAVKQLYWIGKLPPEGPACAIVGARSCSAYGRGQAMALAKYLASRGVIIISGLAAGIDGYAHEGALAAHGETYAVMGCGPDRCYPRSNIGLYEAIRKTGGILSEYAPGTPPLSVQFPARNRIISGLCDAVVVVEARKRSGSLITADFALEQGKSVFALPGRIGDPVSEGTNALIAQGAGIVSSYENVLDEIESIYGCQSAADRKEQTEPAAVLRAHGISPAGQLVYEAFRSGEVLSTDQILDGMDLEVSEAVHALTELLLEGLVEEVSPGLYLRSEMSLAT